MQQTQIEGLGIHWNFVDVFCLDKKLQGCLQRLLCTVVPIQRAAKKLGVCWRFLHWDQSRTFYLPNSGETCVFFIGEHFNLRRVYGSGL